MHERILKTGSILSCVVLRILPKAHLLCKQVCCQLLQGRYDPWYISRCHLCTSYQLYCHPSTLGYKVCDRKWYDFLLWKFGCIEAAYSLKQITSTGSSKCSDVNYQRDFIILSDVQTAGNQRNKKMYRWLKFLVLSLTLLRLSTIQYHLKFQNLKCDVKYQNKNKKTSYLGGRHDLKTARFFCFEYLAVSCWWRDSIQRS